MLTGNRCAFRREAFLADPFEEQPRFHGPAVRKIAGLLVAGAGLGAQIARRFKEEGAELIINDIQDDAAQTVTAEVQGIGIAADVSDSTAIRNMFQQVNAEFGRLDILVNNAGFGFLYAVNSSG